MKKKTSLITKQEVSLTRCDGRLAERDNAKSVLKDKLAKLDMDIAEHESELLAVKAELEATKVHLNEQEEQCIKKLENVLASCHIDLAGQHKLIAALTNQLEREEILKSCISTAEEERVERESVHLEVRKELEETKSRLNEYEQNTNKLDQLNKLLLSE